MIPAEDLGGLLFAIHLHAGSLSIWEGTEEDHVKNPDEIIYREKDVLRLFKKLGFPEPVWGNSINMDSYVVKRKKLRLKRKK